MKENCSCCEEVVLDWRQPANIVKYFTALFKNPVEMMSRFALSGDMASSIALIIMNIIAVFISGIMLAISFRLRYGMYMSWLHISGIGIIAVMVLLSVVFDFGLAGILFLSTGTIFKEETTFSKMLALTASKVAMDSVFIFLGGVLSVISTFFFILLIVAGNILSFAVLILSYGEITDISYPKKLYSIAGSVSVIMIIMVISWRIIYGIIIGLLSMGYNGL